MESFRRGLYQFFSRRGNTNSRITSSENLEERVALYFPPIPDDPNISILRKELQRLGGSTIYTRNLPYTTGFPLNPENIELSHQCPVEGLPSPRFTPEGMLISEILRMPPRRGLTLREILSLLVVTKQNLSKLLMHLPSGCLGIKDSLMLSDQQLISLYEYGFVMDPGTLDRTGKTDVIFKSHIQDRPSQRATDRVKLLFMDARNDWNKLDLTRDHTASDYIFRRLVFQIFSGAGLNPMYDAAGWIDMQTHCHLSDALALLAHYTHVDRVSVGQSVELVARVSEFEPVAFYDSDNNVVNNHILRLLKDLIAMEAIDRMGDISHGKRKRPCEEDVLVASLFGSLLHILETKGQTHEAPEVAPSQGRSAAGQGAPRSQSSNNGKEWKRFKFAPFLNSNVAQIPAQPFAVQGDAQAATRVQVRKPEYPKDIATRDPIEELINSLDNILTKNRQPRAQRTYPAQAPQPRAYLPPEPPQQRGEWVAKMSKTTGKYYWFNKTTKESTWNLPPLPEVTLDVSQERPAPGIPTAPPCPNDLIVSLEDGASTEVATAAPAAPPDAHLAASIDPVRPPASAAAPLAASSPSHNRSRRRRVETGISEDAITHTKRQRKGGP